LRTTLWGYTKRLDSDRTYESKSLFESWDTMVHRARSKKVNLLAREGTKATTTWVLKDRCIRERYLKALLIALKPNRGGRRRAPGIS